ncbi:hypothetical protein [Streptomyces sp. NPDC005244]|uniref:hypothetical protein n=1 Tax=Streptomyces sp. NPDC005244 TaxID=3364708 RepID=UPI0036BF5AF0
MSPDAAERAATSSRHTPGGDIQDPGIVGTRQLEAWAHASPIRLAGYEEDLAEPHILQGVD